MCRTDIDFLYVSSRPVKRRRGAREQEIGLYSSRPVKSSRREEEEISRSNDFLYSSSRSMNSSRSSQRRSRRRRREESSSKDNRRRDKFYEDDDEINRRRRRRPDVSLDVSRSSSNERRRRIEERDSGGVVINYRRSSSTERRSSGARRRDVSLDSRSSNKRRRRRRRRREEISSKSNRCFDGSPNSSSDRSVITEEEEKGDTINIPIGSTKCEDVSCKFCQDEYNADTTPVGSFPRFVDDGLLTDILTRLPVKSLLRFKSVCKRWWCLITQDPHFIHLHLARSESRPKLLCIAPLGHEIGYDKVLPQRILSANLSVKTTSGGEGEVPQVIIHNNIEKTTDDNWFNYDTLLGPVNGLVCFRHWPTTAVRIYNVSTRQLTPWIQSTLLAEEKDKYESEDNPAVKIESHLWPTYQMGFDPEKKEHKVFCFWRLSSGAKGKCYSADTPGYACWEAFTVGHDTKWRRISVVPDENNLIKINYLLPPNFTVGESRPVNANGIIYWRNKHMSCSEYDLVYPERVSSDYAPTEPDVIIAFDVGSEKFRVIPIPSFILDEPREKLLNGPIAMLVLGGRITLVYQMSDFFKLWMLDDGVGKKLENCRGNGSSNWSSETITLPFDTRFGKFHGVPGNNADILLISVYKEICGSEPRKVDSLYSYDLKTKAFKVDKIDGTLSVPLHQTRSLFTTFTESLIPVQPQQDH